jgi:hypothetical protein
LVKGTVGTLDFRSSLLHEKSWHQSYSFRSGAYSIGILHCTFPILCSAIMLSPQLPLALVLPPPSHHSQKRIGKLALSAEKRLSAAAGPDNICESLLLFYPGRDQRLGQEEQDQSESVWRTLVVGGETGIFVGVLRESPRVDWR